MLRTFWVVRVVEVELLHRLALADDVRLHLPCPLAGVPIGALEDLGDEFTRELLDSGTGDLPIDREIDVGPSRRNLVRQPQRLLGIGFRLLHNRVIPADHRAEVERDVQEGPDVVFQKGLVLPLELGDTEVSRCAIAAWASRTWAFDSANVLPPLRPHSREPGQGAFADQLPLELGQRGEDAEYEATGRGGGVDLRALPGEHPQAHAASQQVLHGVDQVGDGTAEAVEPPDDEHIHRPAGAVPVDVDDVDVVQQAVEYRGGEDLVASEDLGPVADVLVRGRRGTH